MHLHGDALANGAVGPVTVPYGAHAYIISAKTAERLALLGDHLISRARRGVGQRTAWQLDGDDIKIDHFLRNYYQSLLPVTDRAKYASEFQTLESKSIVQLEDTSC